MISFYHCRRASKQYHKHTNTLVRLQKDLEIPTALCLAFAAINAVEIRVGLMALPIILTETHDVDEHHFRVYLLDKNTLEDWLNELADEYIQLRTRRKHAIEDLSTDDINVVNPELVERYRLSATRSGRLTVPTYSPGNFNVLRSDFGELLCYLLLEQDYNTRLGYKSICDRDTIHQPARGIDAIGIEGFLPSILTLVLSEVKVSDEQASPPQVVDASNDSLRNQHLEHIRNRKTSTREKIVDLSRRVDDIEFSQHLSWVAFFLEEENWDTLQVISCSILIRPKEKYTKKDFGSFWRKPDDYKPALIRFLIVCIPEDVDIILQMWDKVITDKMEIPL